MRSARASGSTSSTDGVLYSPAVKAVSGLLIGVLVFALLPSSLSRAGEPKRLVEVAVVGRALDASALEAVVRELLERFDVESRVSRLEDLDLREVVTPRPEVAELVARAWFDLRDAHRATMYLVDRKWERVLVRNVPLPHGLDEVAREELGHILEASVETLLAGGQVGLPREEVRTSLGVPAAPPPARPPPPRAETPRPGPEAPPGGPAITLGAFWELQGFSSGALVTHGPGASLGFAPSRAPLRPTAWFTAQYRLPVIVEGERIGVRLDALALRLLVGFDLASSDRVTLSAGAGGGADLVHIAPRSDDAAVSLDASRWTAVPFGRVSVAGRVRIMPNASVGLGVGADIDWIDTVYTVERSAKAVAVLDPWGIRPSMLLAFVGEL